LGPAKYQITRPSTGSTNTNTTHSAFVPADSLLWNSVFSGNLPGIYRLGRRWRLEPLGNAFRLFLVELQTTDQSRHQLTLLSSYLEIDPRERADEPHQEQSFFSSEFL
jgi:hypothetical protein